MNLRLDWVDYAAAKYAVTHWHYSRSMPTPPVNKIGVWESQQFIGVVLFSRGANKNLFSPYGLELTEGAELTRIALRTHIVPVSKIISLSVHLVKKRNPQLRFLISFADPV